MTDKPFQFKSNMKRHSNILPALAALALTLTGSMASCSNEDEVTTGRHWTENGGLKAADNLLFDGNQIGNGDNEFVFTGNQTLPKGTYLLKGWVYIAEGATLTIEPGTVIKGDKQTKAALIVERGGKLFAKGSETQPIVFTSEAPKGQRRPGDWGGLILCGKAPHNAGEAQIEGGPRTKHGGRDPHDCSGAISYVRVEFAGYPFETDKEINGVTFGSVGDGTQVDHVQVSYSNDDSFEWFGGTVNCRYLIAYHGWDDDFDTDNGYQGDVQFGLAVRHSRLADKSQSNGFESDNDASGSAATPLTSATFSNFTFVGPKATDDAFQNTTGYINGGNMFPNNGSGLGRFQAAMQIRRGSRLNCVNSIAFGYPIGLILDGEKGDTQEQATAGNLRLQNLWFAGMDQLGSDANNLYEDVLVTGYDANKKPVKDTTRESFSSAFFKAQEGNRLFGDTSSWMLRPLAGLDTGLLPAPASPLLTAASFSGFASGRFEQVTFVGAFGPADWTAGWANFDPQNTDY